MTLPEGTVTFLRSDIEGSMELVRSLGARYDELNAEHAALVRAAVAGHGGHVVRTEGDAFFVVFSDAGAAARAAVDIQRAMAAHTWPAGHEIKLRIGIHTGSATRAGDDYGGFEVNRAARIAATGWGGQIVVSDTARALIATDLPDDWSTRDLGQHRLKGVSQPERLFQLDAPGIDIEFPGLRSSVRATDRLPQRLTSLIGREDELEHLSGLLAETRLLTLTGPGGTGKTTLALELARRHAADYADGTWFVDLQSIRDVTLVKSEIAHGLDMYDGSAGPAADRLAAYIADLELLVVIDNFEQVLDAADVINEMLQVSPGTCIVITSRVALRLAAEQEFEVRPLAIGRGADDDSEAVRLFVDRVRQVRPSRPVSIGELETVRETCRLLDGLPLAIELTAARASSLPLELICGRLAKHLPLPGSGPRDLPDRQQTIDTTVDWSYQLLSSPLQRLFARLAVFEGSFDYAEAETVAGAADELGIDALDGIFQLSEQSVLSRVEDDVGGVRFGMLETVRSYARARLIESGEVATIHGRHAEAYAMLAEEVAAHMPGGGQARWMARMEPDGANLRAAAMWAIEHGKPDLAIRCAAVPWRFWVASGRLSDGRELIAGALAVDASRPPTALRLKALDAAGGIGYWAGELLVAQARYEEQVALAERLDDDEGRALALLNASFTRGFTGDIAGAEEAFAVASTYFREHGDEPSLLSAEWARVLIGIATGDEQAFADAEPLIARLEAEHDAWFDSMAQMARATMAFARGQPLDAAATGLAGIRLSHDLGDVAQASLNFEGIVGILAWGGAAVAAATVHGAMTQQWQRYGIRPPVPFFQFVGRPDPILAVRERLGADTFAAAQAEGRRMSIAELLDFIEAAMAPITTLEMPPPVRAGTP